MPKTLDEHYGYLSDRIKVGKYQAAIGRITRPKQTMLDLGCGTGLFGLMDLRVGARVVPATIDLEIAPIEVTMMTRHADNVIGWNVELPRSGKRVSQTTFNGLLLERDYPALIPSRQAAVAFITQVLAWDTGA
jgi:hypothetical protein